VVLVEPACGAAPRVDSERPARWLKLLGSVEDWDLPTAPSGNLAGRELRWPRGRGLGGSGRINAMIWFPPTHSDWTGLLTASDHEWSLGELQQSFETVQSIVRPEQPTWMSDAGRSFMATVNHWPDAQPMVYPRVNRTGRRWTPARLIADCHGHSLHESLQIVRAGVERLLFAGDDVIGVEIRDGSSTDVIRARHGVVVCAGAVATPTLLMRSGIGPAEVLSQAGIDVRCDSPKVGTGLQDHLIMPVIFELPASARFQSQPSIRELARWQHLGGGPLASNIAECGGLFEKGRFQIHVTPTHYLTYPGPKAAAAMTVGVNVTQPHSRGRVTVVAGEGNVSTRIEPEYLSDERDLRATVDGVRLVRRIAHAQPLANWHRGELLPSVKRQSEPSIARSVARYAQTLYHPVATCAMGTEADSVVDPSLKVRGVDRLWIADASVLPSLPQGNPNTLVMTVANLWLDRVAFI
jgi:choline dehydrogenase